MSYSFSKHNSSTSKNNRFLCNDIFISSWYYLLSLLDLISSLIVITSSSSLWLIAHWCYELLTPNRFQLFIIPIIVLWTIGDDRPIIELSCPSCMEQRMPTVTLYNQSYNNSLIDWSCVTCRLFVIGRVLIVSYWSCCTCFLFYDWSCCTCLLLMIGRVVLVSCLWLVVCYMSLVYDWSCVYFIYFILNIYLQSLKYSWYTMR